MEKLYYCNYSDTNEIISFDSVSPDNSVWLVEIFYQEKLIDSRELPFDLADRFLLAIKFEGFYHIGKPALNGKHDCSIFEAVNLIPC